MGFCTFFSTFIEEKAQTGACRAPRVGLFVRLGVVAVPIIGAPRVARKPAFVHAFLLLKDFQNAPKAGKSSHAQHSLQQHIFHHQRSHATGDAAQQKSPSHLHAKIVFALNDQGVKQPYAQKCAQSDSESQQMVGYKKFHHNLPFVFLFLFVFFFHFVVVHEDAVGLDHGACHEESEPFGGVLARTKKQEISRHAVEQRREFSHAIEAA